MGVLFATSLVSSKTGQGRIDLHNNDRRFAQLSVDEARAWAMNILQAAEAAETDAFLTSFMDGAGIQTLVAFREYRDAQRATSDDTD